MSVYNELLVTIGNPFEQDALHVLPTLCDSSYYYTLWVQMLNTSYLTMDTFLILDDLKLF